MTFDESNDWSWNLNGEEFTITTTPATPMGSGKPKIERMLKVERLRYKLKGFLSRFQNAQVELFPTYLRIKTTGPKGEVEEKEVPLDTKDVLVYFSVRRATRWTLLHKGRKHKFECPSEEVAKTWAQAVRGQTPWAMEGGEKTEDGGWPVMADEPLHCRKRTVATRSVSAPTLPNNFLQVPKWSTNKQPLLFV